MSSTELPRGVAGNNPLNIRISAEPWQGKIAIDKNTDALRSKIGRVEFEQFIDAPHGLRAGAKILITYKAQGTNTLNKIISKWAPKNENNTEAYLANVLHSMRDRGFTGSQDAVIDADHYDIASIILPSMVQQENGLNQGKDWYSSDVIDQALLLAGISGHPLILSAIVPASPLPNQNETHIPSKAPISLGQFVMNLLEATKKDI